MTRRIVSVLAAILVSTQVTSAQQIAVSAHGDPPPAEIASPLRELLASGGGRAQIGETTLTFWWVESLAVSGAPAWASVAEGSAVGAVRISTLFRDIRGRTIKPGVYALRYAVQPQDGDHLGVSSFRDYLLLSPAEVDQDPAPAGHDGAVNMSKKTIGASHPGAWMLNPPTTSDAVHSTGDNDMRLRYAVFEVPTTGGPLRFGLVLIGRVEA